MGGFKLMASASDVRYAQLQYEDNRRTGESIRKQQEGLDQKRGRMGLGRTLLSFVGGAIGTAGGPIGMAIGAGVGSWLGSTLGGASTGKIDEIEKGKLYKATADEARRQGMEAQVYMKKMAARGALSDAASAFFFAGTDIGKAAQAGATGKVTALGADASLLQKAWASGSGAVAGGAGHIKGSIVNAMRPEATTPVIPELTELEGGFGGDYLQEGLPGRVSTKFGSPGTPLLSPEQIQATEQAMASGLHPSVAAETARWSSASDIAGSDISTKLTIPMTEGRPSSSLDLFNQDIRGMNLASTASDATAQINTAGITMPQELSPLSDAMQYQGPSILGTPGTGMYDPSIQDVALNSWDQSGYLDALAEFRASRDQYGRVIAGGG